MNPMLLGLDLPSGSWLATLVVVAIALAGLGIRVAALGIIPGNRKPSTGMAWLLMILLSPWVGLVAFVFFGSNQLEERRRRRQESVTAAIAQQAGDLTDVALPAGAPAYLSSVVTLNRRLGAFPLLGGNSVEVIADYEASIAEMAAAIEDATDYVNVEFYIAAWDDVTAPVFDALVAAAARGVTVHLLFDHLGSRRIAGYRDFVARLAGTGIDWHAMLPVRPLRGRFRRPDLRNHRKLLVVDGRVGFTGSQNLIEPSYHKPAHQRAGRAWVELMVRLQGPVVAELDAVFAADWHAETGEIPAITVVAGPAPRAGSVTDVSGQVVPSGPGFVAENNLRLFTTLIYGATRRISLTSPYFVPDESLLYAVTTAAQRGIDIELFVSEQSDQFMVGHAQASYYRALLEAGVRIWLYPAPAVLHSKHFTIDDDVAVIGSSNMDLRSFALNYEVSLMLVGEPVVARLRAVEDAYRDLSRELTREEWSQRPAGLRYVDNVMRLTAALQ
nr:cardiolipin synthase [Nocardioides lianchengensis]